MKTGFITNIKWLVFLFLVLCCAGVEAHSKDSLRQVSLIELRVSNDILQLNHRSDKYFSAGFFMSVTNEVFDNKFSRAVLLGSRESAGNFGIFISSKGHTPEDLTLSEIDYNDRPYCGTISINTWRESSNLERNMNFVSYLRLGLSGHASGVDQLQTWMHEKMDGTPPMGWHNQIGTALILDYYYKVNKYFLPNNGWFQMRASAEAEVGTFVGITAVETGVKIGWFNNDLIHHRGLAAKGLSSKRKFQLYLLADIRESYVFYNGTVQGGLVAFESSPYVFGYEDYNHLLTLYTYKLIYSYNRFFLCYRKTLEVGEFNKNEFFGFGTIDIVFPIGR